MTAITFPLTLPNNEDFATVQIVQRDIVGRTRSPWTGRSQKQRHPGQWWEARFRLVQQPRMTAGDWLGWLASLNGIEGTFLAGDPMQGVPRGSAATAPGTPSVSFASQSGEVLVIRGAPASVNNYLLRGDYIQIGSGSTTRLHMLKTNLSTIANGVASLVLWPTLRYSPASGSIIQVQSCQGIWSLTDNRRGWEESNPLFGIEFSAVEDI